MLGKMSSKFAMITINPQWLSSSHLRNSIDILLETPMNHLHHIMSKIQYHITTIRFRFFPKISSIIIKCQRESYGNREYSYHFSWHYSTNIVPSLPTNKVTKIIVIIDIGSFHNDQIHQENKEIKTKKKEDDIDENHQLLPIPFNHVLFFSDRSFRSSCQL